MSHQRPFGVETEYGLAAVRADRTVIQASELGEAMLRAAATLLPTLPATSDHGVFLGNGSRLYLDAGDHPELAGPECLNPWDAVRFLRAGDLVLTRLAEDVRRRNPTLAEARLFTGNVDYSGTGSTWGSHESYAHRAAPGMLRRQIVPHLVSRVIFSGAGGFNPLSHGVEFTLSPRAHHLKHVGSESSMHDRGIANTRDEPLAAHGYRRQHLLCGESLRSDVAAWLRVGTTALVVAMIDGGVRCGDEVELAEPIDALQRLAVDTTCTRPVRLAGGGIITAIRIQRHYLAQARASAAESFMPPWTVDVCDRWAEMLGRLEAGPDHVSTSLDWAIKLAIYRDRVRRHGFRWEALPVWTRAIDAIERRRRADDAPVPPLTAAALDADTELRAEADRFVPALRGVGGDWSDLDRLLALRRELFELDSRWGLLGAMSLFDRIDSAGVLNHRLPGVDRIDEATTQPPAEGRARVRGLVIQRVSPARTRYSCGWDHVWDHKTGSHLDLSDPLTSVEQWSAPEPGRRAAHGGWGFADLRRMLTRVRSRRVTIRQRG